MRSLTCPHASCSPTSGCSCYRLDCPYVSINGGNGLHNHYSSTWHSIDDPGCWMTVAVCGGHCGGHVRPIVNIVETYTWEGLMVSDNFKITHFVGDTDFFDLFDTMNESVGDNHFGFPTVSIWKAYWQGKFLQWFSPFPSSPVGLMDCVYRQGLQNYTVIMTYINGEGQSCETWFDWWGGLFDSFDADDNGNNDNPDELANNDYYQDGEDIYGFTGWWEENENGLSTTRVQALIDDLTYLYGDEATDYAFGRSSFDTPEWYVEFPLGPEQALTSSEINEYLELSGLSEGTTRYAIVEGALKAVGNYYYSPSSSARRSALVNDEGASDEAGFIDHILYNLGIGGHHNLEPYAVIETEHTPYAYDNHQRTCNRDDIRAGDILICPTMDEGTHTGRMLVVIYCDGNGAYVVDCTSEIGGTACHQIDYDDLRANYTLEYNYYEN